MHSETQCQLRTSYMHVLKEGDGVRGVYEYLGHLHFSIRASYGGGRGAWDNPHLFQYFISSLFAAPEATYNLTQLRDMTPHGTAFPPPAVAKAPV